MQNMNSIYYIFSKKSLCETICVCKENEYIEQPILQTGIYQMGTIFSKIMTLLDAWKEKNFSIWHKENIIMDKINAGEFLPPTLSFSRDACGDCSVDKILELLLLGNINIPVKRKNEILVKYLKCYVQYITLCMEQREFCSVDKLQRFIIENGDAMPVNDIYFGIQVKMHDKWSDSEIIELLSDSPEENLYYIPTQINHSNYLSKDFSFEIDFSKNKNTKYDKMEIPLNVFKIYDAVDLILASMHCIFIQGYMIKKCGYCGELFVTRNSKQKYCPSPKYNTTIKTCYQQENLERQLRKEKYEIPKMEKSLRTMLYYNAINASPEKERVKKEKIYMEFSDENREWKERLKNGEKTEAEYAEWLKSKYARKYKNK